MNCPLTKEEQDKLARLYDNELTKVFPQYTRDELRQWRVVARRNLKLEEAKEFEQETFEQRLEKTQKKEEGKKYKSLYENCQVEYMKLKRELEAAQTIIRTPQQMVVKPLKGTGGSEAAMFMVASDWHYEESVPSDVVGGLNRYTLDIADKRINNFFARGLKMYKMFKRDIPIPTIVLCLLGDFISGSIHEELVEGNQLLPADAAWEVQNRIIGGIDYLLNNTKADLIIPCHSGNHGRMTEKTHFGTEAGNSLEIFMYRNIQLHFRNEKRIRFMIAEGYHTYLNVYHKTVRIHHGHAMKYGGGVGGIYIPINKAIAQWNKGRWADLDVFGHFHQFRDGGNFICNGSLIGYNAYALSIKADFEEPKQAIFLIDNKRGKTITAPILVAYD